MRILRFSAGESSGKIQVSGASSVNHTTFYDTDRGSISKVYNGGVLLEYSYIAYTPQYSGEVIVANNETGDEIMIVDDGYSELNCLRSAYLMPDKSGISISYDRRDDSDQYADTVTESFDIDLP